MVHSGLITLFAFLWLQQVNGDAVQELQERGRPQVDAMIAKSKVCTKEKLQIRKEWGDVSKDDRRAYIKAVLCLMDKPPKLTQYAGVTNRYEDFVAVHINQTMAIHDTGSFLSWHRYFLWAFEQYWDWGKWCKDPETSPIFDGSDTSLGGNGEKITGRRGTSYAPAGNGGGCVVSGPFKNITTHLGPISPAVNPPPPSNPQSNGMGKNSRCLRRDISNYLTSRYARPEDIVSLIINSTNVGAFQKVMQSSTSSATPGVHGVGHYTIGGDPGADFYTSPGDPAFWVHHGMIDRVWAIWQSLDIEKRTMVIAGSSSMMSSSRPQSLDDVLDLGVVGSKYKIRDLVSTVDGPFCYTYE